MQGQASAEELARRAWMLDPAPQCRVYGELVRIAELAEQVGVPTSTVRYYERIGLLPLPARTPSGYRDYDDGAATQLLFITRGRRMGLSCEQLTDLLPIWNGSNCAGAQDRVIELLTAKRAEIRERIAELERFDAQLEAVGTELAESPPPQSCRTDLSCCVPESGDRRVTIELTAAPSGTARHTR
jgi:DNA-binding transcriptional MerR regulator